MTDTNNKLLRPAKAAEMLGISVQTLRVWGATGKIEVIRTAGGHRRVRIEEIERLVPRKDKPKAL